MIQITPESKILIPINRRTIQQLEKAIIKHNKENSYNISDYVYLINKLLDDYLIEENKNEK